MENYGHDFARLKEAFVNFVQRLPFYGVAVLCVDDANVRDILPAISRSRSSPTASAEDAQLRAIDVAHAVGRMRFVAHSGDGRRPRRRAQSRRRAQRAERARRDRRRPRDRRRRCSDREGAVRIPRRRTAGSSATATSPSRGGETLRADRRLRTSPGRDGCNDRRRARGSFPGRRRGARVPAAPLYAYARPVRGFRAGLARRPTRSC